MLITQRAEISITCIFSPNVNACSDGFRVCLGLMRLADDYPQRLNDACRVANRNGLARFRQVREILRNGMDTLPLFDEEDDAVLPQHHKNIRGANQYK